MPSGSFPTAKGSFAADVRQGRCIRSVPRFEADRPSRCDVGCSERACDDPFAETFAPEERVKRLHSGARDRRGPRTKPGTETLRQEGRSSRRPGELQHMALLRRALVDDFNKMTSRFWKCHVPLEL